MAAIRSTSCGVLVSDGVRILLGHATRSPRWDIPKGVAEPLEAFRDAARRELQEETGFQVHGDDLIDLGIHSYLRTKQLALFGWAQASLPDPGQLVCRSVVTTSTGVSFPEFDRFGLFEWDTALTKVGRNLARILGTVDRTRFNRKPPVDPLAARA